MSWLIFLSKIVGPTFALREKEGVSCYLLNLFTNSTLTFLNTSHKMNFFLNSIGTIQSNNFPYGWKYVARTTSEAEIVFLNLIFFYLQIKLHFVKKVVSNLTLLDKSNLREINSTGSRF